MSESATLTMSACSLQPFFCPRSVAVIGASRDPSSIGFRLLDAIVQGDFQGPIYPINPRATLLHGLRAYPSLHEVPEAIDLAIVAVPREAVLPVVDDCAERGVPALLVISAGFAEVGAEGERFQNQLLQRVRRAGMRMIGPNCLGLVNADPAVRLNATFVPLSPPPGGLAMSSDSGALGVALLATAMRLGIGVSSFVSVGNRADVAPEDLLEFWGRDERTDVIALYLESLRDPQHFAGLARQVSRLKPIVAVKAGRSRAGQRAAGSHTAALASRDVAVDALFRHSGVVRVGSVEELFEVVTVLSTQPLPRGRRVGILTNAGGPGILCADTCEASGLTLPELSPATRARLAAFLPREASLTNPVDMIAYATTEHYRQALKVLLDSGEVDSLIVINVHGASITDDEFEQTCAAGAEASPIPVLLCLMASPRESTVRLTGAGRLPCYAFPEAPARALGRMAVRADWLARSPGCVPSFASVDLPAVRNLCSGEGWLTLGDSLGFLRAAGFPVVAGKVVQSADEASRLAEEVGFPVVLKLASRGVIHKTEVGGVRLGLQTSDAVRRAFEELRALQGEAWEPGEGVLVQPLVQGGTEVMLGMTREPLFGPLLAFGLGGIHVEVLGDICFRLAPLTDVDAAEMVRAIRGYAILAGHRGHAAADIAALEQLLLRLSFLVQEVPRILEVDLNPVLALTAGQGCRIVDARIRLSVRD